MSTWEVLDSYDRQFPMWTMKCWKPHSFKKKMLETSLSHLQFEPNITPTVSLQTSLYIAEKFDDNKTEHCKGIVIYY